MKREQIDPTNASLNSTHDMSRKKERKKERKKGKSVLLCGQKKSKPQIFRLAYREQGNDNTVRGVKLSTGIVEWRSRNVFEGV